MKQIEVQIMGQGYLLSCPDDGQAMLLDAVGRVDSAMCKVRDAGKVRTRDRIAVLASLNLAVELSELYGQSLQTMANLQAALAEVHTRTAPAQASAEASAWADLERQLDAALAEPQPTELNPTSA